MPSNMRDLFKSERLDRFTANVRDGFLDRIGRVDQFEIGLGNHSALRHLANETDQSLPIIGSHDHDWKAFDFPGLNQGHGFKQLVECTSASWHHDRSEEHTSELQSR